MNKPPYRLALFAVLAAAIVLAVVPAALAGKGGGGGNKPPGGGGGGGSTSSSLSLVLLDSSDGLPHWGQHVTFNVSTTTAYPYVTLTCYQNGASVSTMTAGFYPSYIWGQTFALSSTGWRGGAADCTADLHYSSSNGKKVTLATLTFHVYA